MAAKILNMTAIIGQSKILRIELRGTARPVETAVNQTLIIKQGKFMVHVVTGIIEFYFYALTSQIVDVAANIVDFVIISNDPDFNATLMGS